MMSGLQLRVARSMEDIAPAAWNALTDSRYPFLRHEFLSALERTGCLGRKTGWFSHFLLFEDEREILRAALPMYLKSNSFGEFVFDWAWADAYRRCRLDYYPKLVVASPFTPAAGPRILIRETDRSDECYQRIARSALAYADALEVSSLHWLFSTDPLDTQGDVLLKRWGCQFHWRNRSYRSFDDFLSRLTAKRRNQIKRERRQVRDAGVTLKLLSGSEVPDGMWETFHDMYRATFDKRGNYPALTLAFFRTLGRTMGDQILLVFACRANEPVAAAFFLVGADTLYGRYWGCLHDIPALHFEACYYQGVEYCIAKGLKRFEPGAQGEHKLARGFSPTSTWSYHWIRNVRFRRAIKVFLEQEAEQMQQYMHALSAHSPFKQATG